MLPGRSIPTFWCSATVAPLPNQMTRPTCWHVHVELLASSAPPAWSDSQPRWRSLRIRAALSRSSKLHLSQQRSAERECAPYYLCWLLFTKARFSWCFVCSSSFRCFLVCDSCPYFVDV